MTIKPTYLPLINPDHIPVNRFELIVPGLVPPVSIVFTTVSGFEEELQTVDLPNRTRASGGNVSAFEFTATHPLHHTDEVIAMEAWFKETIVVSPGYKKAGTLRMTSLMGIPRTYGLVGVFPSKRKMPDLDMNNEGEIALIEWTFQCDFATATGG